MNLEQLLTPEGLTQAAVRVIVLLMSLGVHEFAHAWMAFRLGDDTAARQGRLTLNPLAHADPIGTFVLPILGVPFGWAKPVPFDPTRFKRSVTMSQGTMLVKVAGPASNVLLAIVTATAYGLLARFAPQLITRGSPIYMLTGYLVVVNSSLAVLNMLPIHPLDGGGVVDHFMPRALRPAWEQFSALGPFLLIGVFVLARQTGFLDGPTDFLAGLVFDLGSFVAGA